MAQLKDRIITKIITHQLTAEYSNSAGNGSMEIKLDGQHADILSAWGGKWYYGFLEGKPEDGREIIGSTPEEALDWWVKSRGFAVAKSE
jgi:hypothetical protein